MLEKLGKKRVLLNGDQRRLLAVKGKAIGRKALMELTTIVTPDTILRWHRQLVAKKWDQSHTRKSTVGRPRVRQVIVDLILRFARESPSWGYDRIQGGLANLGYYISDTTVANVLKAHGIEPAPDRQRKPPGPRFSKHTGMYWQQSTLPPLKSGREAGWLPITCCSSWSLSHDVFTLPDARPIPIKLG